MSDDSLKYRALLSQALGMCRGILYSVRAGDVDIGEIDRILDATSLANIAKRLGLDENDLVIDFEDDLSDDERLDR
jgi:hypothetical protein